MKRLGTTGSLPAAALFENSEADLAALLASSTAAEHELLLDESELDMLFRARCEDQGLPVNPDRKGRFRDFVAKSSAGLLFSVREAGLGERSAAALSKIFRSCNSYSQLDLSGNRIHDEGAAHIAKMLTSEGCGLVRVAVANCEISKRGVALILESLVERNRHVANLDIHRNHMGQRSCELLGQVLQRNSVLHELNVSCNGFGAEGIVEFVNGLACNSSLAVLNMSANSIGFEGIRSFVQCCIPASPPASCKFAVTRLSLARNGLGDRGIVTLCKAIADSKSKHPIRDLDLSDNGFSAEGFQAVIDMIKVDRKLEMLSLARNVWTTSLSAGELADALATNTSLRRLSLSQCKIYDDAGAIILEGVSRMAALEVIDVSQNFLENESGMMIAKCINPTASQAVSLMSSSMMKNLGMSTSGRSGGSVGFSSSIARIIAEKNRIGDVGGLAIAEALRANRPHFLALSLSNTKLRDSGEAIAKAMTEANFAVRELDVSLTEMRYEYVVAIEQAVARNVARYKASRTDRLKSRVDELKSNENQLDITLRTVVEEKQRLALAKETMVVTAKDLVELRDKIEIERKRLHEQAQEATNARFAAEGRLEDIGREITVARSVSESKIGVLQTRIENETKKRLQIMKNVKRKENEIEDERKRQEEENKPLRDQVEKAKRRVEKADKEFREDRDSLLEYVTTWKLDPARYASLQ
jgi:Ran GTPase-activating protein (RanGAP) involved in mRNA processing and transport